jgi:peroxiredoxin
MKRNYMFFLIMILFSSNVFCQKKQIYENGYIVKVGDQAPDFTINEAGGKSYKLSGLKGRVVMLQFTASWCSVCRTEMPFIEKEIWKEKERDGLIVIGIDRDEPVDKVLKFRKDVNVTYPMALDPGASIFSLYAEKEAGITRNVIIDRSGKIIFLTRLYERKEFDQMKKIIFAELVKK